MTFGPVVTGARLSEDEVVGTEELAKRTGTDGIHSTGLQIDKDSAGNVFVARSLIEIDIHPLELEVAGSIVAAKGLNTQSDARRRKKISYLHTGAIETVLARDGLPESSTNLVTLKPC